MQLCTTEGDGICSNASSPKYMTPQMNDAIGTPPQVKYTPNIIAVYNYILQYV